MLKSADLKTWLHQDLPRLEKLLLVLAVLDRPALLAEVRDEARKAGFRIPATWNVSSTLARSKGKAIRTPEGWEITDSGKALLRSLGVADVSPSALNVASDLRKHLENIADTETRAFLDEAINCHEYGLYRAAIVMSWVGAVSVLHKHVHSNHLALFNKEASRVDDKWKVARTRDDLGRMNEDKFLDTIERISVIGKNVKDALKECLKRRNGCGHPNSLKVSINQSAAHLEVLLHNVFEPFSHSQGSAT
ncbi:hypothetical protein ACRDNQ_16255 [Palleronia sp. KMU-117]|uniref:hypothetical protein n=1 Tax=Palleronia sp. KMU-117 TaxID=3434108 RepID=UPI003D7354FE